MGFTPTEIDRMSLYQFACAVGGYAEAHGAEPETTYPTDDEFYDIVRRFN